MEGRGPEHQARGLGFGAAQAQGLDQARLADAGFAAEQQRLAAPGAGLLPGVLQGLELGLPALHRHQALLQQGIEAVPGAQLPDPVELHRLGNALQVVQAQRFAFQQALHQAMGVGTDGQAVRRRGALHPRADIGGLAQGQLLDPQARPHRADHHRAGVHADAYLDRHAGAQRADVVQDLQACLHPAQRVVLVRGGVAKVDQDAVAQVLRHIAI